MTDASENKPDNHAKAGGDAAQGTQSPKEAGQGRQEHFTPSRWWFASAAFPMIAGTLGPVASAFSICALVRPWRQGYRPGMNLATAPYIPDPSWLTVINAIQLAIALIANLALLLNMTRRLRFSIAQPVTILGWYVSAICLVALAATAAGPLVKEPKDQFVWSQAFYYAIYSACLYFVVASLLVVTFLGALAGRYEKEFRLGPSQRTLMLQTISFLTYTLLGSLVFSVVEGWNYLDAVYWAAVTLFTVGFGDVYPSTALGRGLLFPYALVGTVSLGLVVGSIRALIIQRGKRRLDARIMEKKRRGVIRRLTLRGDHEILVPVKDQTTPSQPDGTGLTEFKRREQEFKLMRKIQDAADRRRRWCSMAVAGSSWLVLWLVGAKIFQEAEAKYQGWTYFDGVYLAFVSVTTIGYGDVIPLSNAGRSFWVFWAFLALPTTTVAISYASDTIIKLIRDTTDQIATITILPGEHGFKTEVRTILKKLSFGTLFEEDIEDTPTGFLGDLPTVGGGAGDTAAEGDEEGGGVKKPLRQDKEEEQAEKTGTAAGKDREKSEAEDEGRHHKKVDENAKMENEEIPRDHKHVKESAQPPETSHGDGDSSPSRVLPEMPATKAEYRLTLMEEISRVLQDLKSNPPKKYSFQEWAWYLRLIGEDEGDADRHRTPEQARLHLPNILRHGRKAKEKNTAGGGDQEEEKPGEERSEHDEGKHKPWSWVGTRSPLMGSHEEAEWILDRLMERLREEMMEDVDHCKREHRSRSDLC